MKCPECGYENGENKLKCNVCGAILKKDEESMEKEPQTPEPEVITSLYTYVGFGRRLVAYIIDFALISFSFAILVVFGAESIPDMLAQLAMAFYFIGFWVLWNGQTIGKKIMKIKIITIDGKPLTAGKAMWRYFGYILSSMALFMGFLWIIWDKKHQGWHDKMAKTLVIKC